MKHQEVHIYSKTYGHFVALVSAEDFPLIRQYRWRIVKRGKSIFVASTTSDEGKPITMQQLLMPKEPGKVIYHINQNRLDNRRENMELRPKDEAMRCITAAFHNTQHKSMSKKQMATSIPTLPAKEVPKPTQSNQKITTNSEAIALSITPSPTKDIFMKTLTAIIFLGALTLGLLPIEWTILIIAFVLLGWSLYFTQTPGPTAGAS